MIVKNRKQVIYNPEYIKKQHEKIQKNIEIKKIFKIIYEDINNIIESNKYNTNYDIAIVIYMIAKRGFRIGNEKYKTENNSFGITTLLFKHLNFYKNELTIDFIGKKGVLYLNV